MFASDSDRPRAAVLHSGGLDSTVCLLMAQEEEKDVISIGIDYGQRHRIELEYANYQCSRFGIPRRVIKVEWDKPARELPLDRTVDEIKSSVSSAFLPGRNMVFLALGIAEAAGLGAKELWIGVNSIDFSGYPDCSPEFVTSFSEMLRYGVPKGPAIRAPLQLLTKPEIVAIAKRLSLSSGDTWSCYRPNFSGGGVNACGRCDACKLHEHAWGVAN